MSGHWEEINGNLYWFDLEDVCVPVDAMNDEDWIEAIE